MSAGLFSPPLSLTGLFARVVLERGIDNPDGLTYSIPTTLADVQPGERIRAPLGRNDRPVEGYIVEVLVATPGLPPGITSDRIKPLLARAGRAGTSNRFPPSLIRLALWISQYYCTPIGMVLAAMVPAAVKRQTGSVERKLLELGPPDSLPELSKSARAAWEAVRGLPAAMFPVDERRLADAIGARTVAPIRKLLRAGLLREVVRSDVRANPGAAWTPAPGDARARQLASAQERAVESIAASLGSFTPHLLFGVTGSGKTEVYLHVLQRVIDRGECAIVLVPEISLTPQTAGRFIARFGEAGVAVLHSGLTASQRHQQWRRVAEGDARIVVGARSAVFAPIAGKLGLIVVDEEHDTSYKQDQLPRYSARDVALRRAQLESCPVVLGSATPSMESWHNALGAAEGGAARFNLLELPERVGGGKLPRVEVVDLMAEMREHRELSRRLHAIGPRLERELRATLDGEGQAILLLNRRGYANYICCPDQTCGWYLTCNHCDVTVVYHKRGSRGDAGGERDVVMCHHCLAEQKLPALCPVCAKRVTTFGFGTQRLEEELAQKFPKLASGSTMLRLDSDSMRRAADYFAALERFRRGEARILLGTQMVAKGLDFPNVELIGVINADTALGLADFRAEERTFQLVSQVAGRAGRSAASSTNSRVIVQTMNPRAPAITLAAAHNFRDFAARELDLRREAGLPPIWRMARIVCRDLDAGAAQRAADDIFAAFRERAAGDPAVRLRPAAPCAIARIGDFYRFAVEVLAETPATIQRLLTDLRAMGLVRSDARTAVDVDPVALL